MPYYEENSLDTQQRDNKELNLYFEGPYSNGNGDSEPHEAANSSKILVFNNHAHTPNPRSSWNSAIAKNRK